MALAETQLLHGNILECDDSRTLLHRFFERQVARWPNRLALECNAEALTYAELDARANQIANMLHARGFGPGSLIALYFDRTCLAFAALLGVLKAGAGYVPIDPKTPIQRIQSIIEDASIGAILSAELLSESLSFFASTMVIVLDRNSEKLNSYPLSSVPVSETGVKPTDPCYVIFTSGSTGRPKGVVVEHRQAVNFARSLDTVYKLNEQDRIYQGFSLAFDASVEEIWGALSLGGTLVVPNDSIARSPSDAADFINNQCITYFSTVPSFLAMIEVDLPTVRLLVVGGEECPAELVSQWAQHRRMLNTYGPTEATVVATSAECIPGQPVTIGTALPGYTVHVLDEQLQPVGSGETGELFIGGRGIARGYLNRDELTRERFIPDTFDVVHDGDARLFRTNDLVRWTVDGALQFVGRKDSLVKIRGFRVELSEIEAVLMEQQGVRAAAATVRTEGGLQEIAAFVVPAGEANCINNSELSQALRGSLPEYMLPKYLDVIEELPRLTSGKIDRNQLPPSKTLLTSKQRNAVCAETALESSIVEIYENCFRLSPIFVSDDFFFDLGGHSLLAARVASALRSRFGPTCIAVRDIYEHRTIRQLSHYLEEKGIVAEENQIGRKHERILVEKECGCASAVSRWVCLFLQALSLVVLYGIVAAPATLLALIHLMVANGELSVWDALKLGSVVGFLAWPFWLMFSIALKWMVIGRYKPGRYPLWGAYYFRWWLVSRFQPLSWSGMFVGTPLMSVYYRAMGAKVGRNSMICTPLCTAFDLISIGENTSIGAETHLLGYRVENGWLLIDKVTIGDNCFVGAHSNLALNVVMEEGARLDDMSLLADGEFMRAGEARSGSPSKSASVPLPSDLRQLGPKRRAVLFGLFHLGLIYVMGYFLILSAVPGAGLILLALQEGGPAYGFLAAIAAVLVFGVSYLLIVIATQRIAIGRISSGIYRQDSVAYLRLWFSNYLLENTRRLLLPLYGTLVFPKVLRLLRAKIGKNVEISTVMHVTPDLLDVGDGSFLADACIVGGQRVHGGLVEVLPNRIGARTFIGNSAHVRGGVEVGDEALIGVMSTPPPGLDRTPNGTRWLGSPSFELPLTQQATHFSDTSTYHPSRGLITARALFELIRVILPASVLASNLVLFAVFVALAYQYLPVLAVLCIAPCVVILLCLLTIAATGFVKQLLVGVFSPVSVPLWSPHVWANEIVNGLYESVASPAIGPLAGTPFLAPCLRLMGCRIGRWVFLETTLFSEFDLVQIGDHAALNLGVTVQTHLFEDRVMKADVLNIGDHCSVGNMSVVLYGTKMLRGSSLGPLSLLMKGETLPQSSSWYGIPTELMNAGAETEMTAPPLAPKLVETMEIT